MVLFFKLFGLAARCLQPMQSVSEKQIKTVGMVHEFNQVVSLKSKYTYRISRDWKL